MIEPRVFATKGPIRLGVIVIFVVLAGVAGWAISAPVGGAIIAVGRIESDQQQVSVKSAEPGSVAVLYVSEGDFVRQNDRIVSLDTRDLLVEQDRMFKQLWDTIAQRCRLAAESKIATIIDFSPLTDEITAIQAAPLIATQQRLFDLRQRSLSLQRQSLSHRRQQILDQQQALAAQQGSAERQLALVQQELAIQTDLSQRGLTAGNAVLALSREATALSGQLGALSATMSESESRLDELRTELAGLVPALAEAAMTQQGDLFQIESDLRARLLHLERQLQRSVIHAPVAGYIADLAISAPGALIREAEPIANVVARDGPTHVQTRISTEDIDRITVGQMARLRFSSLDLLHVPERLGQITAISPSSSQDPTTGAFYYEIQILIAVDSAAPGNAPNEFRLGIPVDVLIPTENKTPMEYLLAPLTTAFVRSFRDN